MVNYVNLIFRFVFRKCFHSRRLTHSLNQNLLRYLSIALSICFFGHITGAQDSISIGSSTVIPSTSEVVIPVNLAVDSDISLLSLTINFDAELLTTSEEKIIPVPERFPGENIDDITTSVDSDNGVISWTVSDFLGGAVIESGTGTLFTIEFALKQMVDEQGTALDLAAVQATDTSLNTLSLTSENGTIAASQDSDQDNLPDDWEVEHFGDLRFSGDDDADRDGRTNLEEFSDSSDPFAVELEVSKGWNLLSLGIAKDDNSIQAVFGDRVIGLAWVWDSDLQRYTPAQTILPENGYWVYSKTDFVNDNAIVIDLP